MASMDTAKQRRQYIAIGSIVLVGVLVVVAALVFLGGEDEEETVQTTFVVTEEDANELANLSEDFIESAGHFGTDVDSINENNVLEMQLNTSRQVGSYESYFDYRSDTYLGLEDFIYSGGPVDYPQSTVNSMDLSQEHEDLTGYTIGEVTANVPEEGVLIEIDGIEDVESVTVPVSFGGEQTKITRTATDSSWDGSFNVLVNNTTVEAEIVFVNGSEGWQVFDVDQVTEPYFLATWEDPNMEDYLEGAKGLQQTDVLQSSHDGEPGG